jgi:dienelactone hydrolase
VAYHLKGRFDCTLADLSPEMVAVSRARNPECAHAVGDMRELDLGRTFDVVFVHDAIDYLGTEADLAAAFATAFRHLAPGGLALFVPDHVSERFGPGTEAGGSDAPDGRGARWLEWCSSAPDPPEALHATSAGAASMMTRFRIGSPFTKGELQRAAIEMTVTWIIQRQRAAAPLEGEAWYRREMVLLITGIACAAGGAPAEGFAGTSVFQPEGRAAVAVVVLHGSEGGSAPYAPWLAAELARRGFVAAAFCWFGCEGTPDRIQRVPLDHTVDFLTWFQDGPARGLPVVVYGASRGAEHALLLASLLGDTKLVAGVASHAGTDTVVAGFDPRTMGPITTDGGYDAAWTWRGEPLYGERAMPFGSGPRLAIERYPGPVWLSHGELDPLWPASRSRALVKARGALPTELHTWPGEGHVVQSRDTVEALLASLVAFANARAAAPPTP